MNNLKVLDTLKFGFSNPETFILSIMLPILSFCAEPKAKSQNPSSNITLALRERVNIADGG